MGAPQTNGHTAVNEENKAQVLIIGCVCILNDTYDNLVLTSDTLYLLRSSLRTPIEAALSDFHYRMP